MQMVGYGGLLHLERLLKIYVTDIPVVTKHAQHSLPSFTRIYPKQARSLLLRQGRPIARRLLPSLLREKRQMLLHDVVGLGNGVRNEVVVTMLIAFTVIDKHL